MPLKDKIVDPRRIIIGISGALGVIYTVHALEYLRDMDRIETHLVISDAGVMSAQYELDMNIKKLKSLSAVSHTIQNIGTSIASESFQTAGMLVMLCSIRTMSDIAYGTTSNLLTRAADVPLKERRPLVLLVREIPLHVGHFRTMTHFAEIGVIIAPPVTSFYAKPKTLDDVVRHMVSRTLDIFGIDTGDFVRWTEG